MTPGPLQVLLVDDHEESLVVLARLLRRCHYEVQTARSFAEAMASSAAARQRFDLLIADVGLPDRSGLELMHELRDAGWVGKGIALSGFTEAHDAQASAAAGFAKHLNKPVMFNDLLSAIQQVTGFCVPGEADPAAAFGQPAH